MSDTNQKKKKINKLRELKIKIFSEYCKKHYINTNMFSYTILVLILKYEYN